MKTNLSLTLAIIVVSASVAFACDGDKTKDTKKATTAEKPKTVQTSSAPADKGGVLLTGSYIKQKNVRRSGRLTDGASQVIVLDRDTIERSGVSDVRQLLTHQGIR